tara:strand:+ start:124 stop:582 length:459 start_codon:yes stop_codon:yes gene_type:complete
MKKILLLILVGTIPFMSIAQKRSKKNSNAKMGEFVKKSPSEYEYMIIEGVQSIMSDEEKMMDQNELAARDGAKGDIKMKGMIKSRYKHFVRFDTGKITPEQMELNKMARSCSHMSDALYQASKLGWEFISASHVSNEEFITHYYYMKRKRDK